MKNFLFAFFVLSSIVVFSQKKQSPEVEFKQTIDNYLKQTIKANEIPGLAVGVIKDGRITSEGYFIAGKHEFSKRYYLKSLPLNPKNDNARKKLSKIEK